MLDAILGQARSRPAHRTQIEAAMLLAGGRHRPAPVALGQHDQATPRRLELVHVGIHTARGGWSEEPDGIPAGVLAGPA